MVRLQIASRWNYLKVLPPVQTQYNQQAKPTQPNRILKRPQKPQPSMQKRNGQKQTVCLSHKYVCVCVCVCLCVCVYIGTLYHGMSTAAAGILARAHGYTLVYVMHSGINCVMLRNDPLTPLARRLLTLDLVFADLRPVYI